jgi:hypothetical protein
MLLVLVEATRGTNPNNKERKSRAALELHRVQRSNLPQIFPTDSHERVSF